MLHLQDKYGALFIKTVSPIMEKLVIALISLTLFQQGQAVDEPDLPEYAVPVLQNWLHQNSEAVEVCVFRREWKAPTEKFPKGIMHQYATITHVHKGEIKVGQRVKLTAYIEYPRNEWRKQAELKPDSVTYVEGDLMVVMFSREDIIKVDDYWDVGADISRFSFDDVFYRVFQLEQKRDPELRGMPH